jgi:hypothetical protein
MYKKKCSDILTEKGFFNDKTKSFVKESLQEKIDYILEFAENETELRIIGSNLNAIINDRIADIARDRNTK